MGFQLKENEYYLVTQIVEGYKENKYKFYECNEETIVKITRILVGKITVYIYNEEDNSRIDKTKELGRAFGEKNEFRKINCCHLFFKYGEDFKIEMFYALVYMDILNIILSEKERMYINKRLIIEKEYKYIYLSLKECMYVASRKIEENKNNEIKIKKGEAFEKYIGKKYENANKKVIYNGINKKKKDNGIDLIVEDENKIYLVQCKNWINMEWNKINQKDLRAFIGDCFIYITKFNVKKKVNFHFIVSDENLLTESAKIFLEENKVLKFKIIPFE